MAEILDLLDIPYHKLDAVNHREEAAVVAQAGKPGMVNDTWFDEALGFGDSAGMPG